MYTTASSAKTPLRRVASSVCLVLSVALATSVGCGGDNPEDGTGGSPSDGTGGKGTGGKGTGGSDGAGGSSSGSTGGSTTGGHNGSAGDGRQGGHRAAHTRCHGA